MRKFFLHLVTFSAIMLFTVPTVVNAESLVTTSGVNFRSAPSLSSSVIEIVPRGSFVESLSQTKYWYKVSYNNKVGYISTSYAKPSSQQKIEQIIAYGMTFKGVPYIWGGDYDKDGSMGFDCSGFVHYIYAKYGVNVTRQSAASAKSDGYTVSRSQLRRGDLIYTDTNRDGEINHISIYLGNDQLLHTYKVGVGVTVSKFSGSNWDKTFVTAKRVI